MATMPRTPNMMSMTPRLAKPSIGVHESSSDWINDYKREHTDDMDYSRVFTDAADSDSSSTSTDTPKHPTQSEEKSPGTGSCSTSDTIDAAIFPLASATIKRKQISGCFPTRMDVIFGRGGKGNHHPGNKHYRDIVRGLKEQYNISTKCQKTDLSKSIVDCIKCEGGRFLIQGDKPNKWYEATDKAARRKVSQAFRELERIREKQSRRKKRI